MEFPIDFPTDIRFFSCDEVAECVVLREFDPESNVYAELWTFVGKGSDPKPLGGDGSNGTVEEPVVSQSFSDGILSCWPKLSDEARKAIIESVERLKATGKF